MTHLRLGLVVLALPVLTAACTADQFGGGDSGDDATPDGTTSDGGGIGDGSVSDGITVDIGPPVDANCGTSTAFSCKSSTCIAPAQYCNDGTGICAPIPGECACNYNCACLQNHVTGLCSTGGTLTCSMNSGGATLTCN